MIMRRKRGYVSNSVQRSQNTTTSNDHIGAWQEDKGESILKPCEHGCNPKKLYRIPESHQPY